MKKGRNSGFVLESSGAIVALNLGADFCSEHEHGYSGLRNTLLDLFNAAVKRKWFWKRYLHYSEVTKKALAEGYTPTRTWLDINTWKSLPLGQSKIYRGHQGDWFYFIISQVDLTHKGVLPALVKSKSAYANKLGPDSNSWLYTAWDASNLCILVKGDIVPQVESFFEHFSKNELAFCGQWLAGCVKSGSDLTSKGLMSLRSRHLDQELFAGITIGNKLKLLEYWPEIADFYPVP